jgi:hypothetical protein
LASDIKGGTLTEMFVSRVLRRMFGPKRDEIVGGLGKIA